MLVDDGADWGLFVTGQTLMGEFMDDDKSMPEPTARPGGQKYTEPDAGTDSGQEQATAAEPGGMTKAQAMVIADGNEGVARRVLELDKQLGDLSQDAEDTGNDYLAAATGDAVKDVMGTVATGAFGLGLATGNPVLMGASLVGAAATGGLKGVAGKGVENTVQNLHKDNNNLRDAAKETWLNTDIGQRISDFRNRSAYEAQAGDGSNTDSEFRND